jgi:hypothetical protein
VTPTLDAHLDNTRDRQPQPQVAAFASAVDVTLATLEAVARKAELLSTLSSGQGDTASVEALPR